MPVLDSIGRRRCIPILYTYGTHYEVGFDVGRTFSSIIQNFVAHHGTLNKVLLPVFETDDGKKAYESTLASVRKNFPQYVLELEGTADGSKVPFYKLFLLHMDDILPLSVSKKGSDSCAGCSTVCCNLPGQEILGHNEDALSETLNHYYFVSAHIVSDKPQGRYGVTEERFTSLCYAGTLPGFTMSYNTHGFLYSINIVSAKKLRAGKTPRTFLTRALLAAETFSQAQEIMRDRGVGLGDGVSINMTFLKQEGNRLFHNAEVGPPSDDATTESTLNILTVSPGENFQHTNRYLRLKIPQVTGAIIASSEHREQRINEIPPPKTFQEVADILGDNADKEYPVYREQADDDYVKTIATGIFNCSDMTWSIYADNPKTTKPIVVLPIVLK